MSVSQASRPTQSHCVLSLGLGQFDAGGPGQWVKRFINSKTVYSMITSDNTFKNLLFPSILRKSYICKNRQEKVYSMEISSCNVIFKKFGFRFPFFVNSLNTPKYVREARLGPLNDAINSSCVRLPFVELHAAHNNCRLSGASCPAPGTRNDMVDRHIPKWE